MHLPSRRRTRAILMLNLFVAPTSFEGLGEYSHDRTTSSLVAVPIVMVSVGSLALAICRVLVILLAGELTASAEIGAEPR